MYGVEKDQMSLTVQALQVMFTVMQQVVKLVDGQFLKKALEQESLLAKHKQAIYTSGVLLEAHTTLRLH